MVKNYEGNITEKQLSKLTLAQMIKISSKKEAKMVIQTRIHDGISVKTRVYRKVIKGVNLAQYREGFYAQALFCKWGEMIQLKGKQRIKLARFGRVEE